MNPYFSVFTTHVPAIIILAGWFYYMLKTKSQLSMLLFVSSFLSLSMSIFTVAYNITSNLNGDIIKKIKMMSLLGNLNVGLHLAYAIIFIIFLTKLLNPKTGEVPISEYK